MNICRQFPGAEFWTNIFTPYPGAPVMERAFELGIQVPQTMEGWSDFFPRYTVLPWLKGKKHREVQIMRDYLRVAFHRVPVGRYERSRLNRAVYEMIAAPARWRLDHNFFSVPGGTVGQESGGQSNLAAQADGGRDAAQLRAGDLLR